MMSSEHFIVPRPKESTLPPQPKKRKRTAAIEEISFDFDKRADYLTGFHKRKVERMKRAQAENEKKAKEERILQRKQVNTSSPLHGGKFLMLSVTRRTNTRAERARRSHRCDISGIQDSIFRS